MPPWWPSPSAPAGCGGGWSSPKAGWWTPPASWPLTFFNQSYVRQALQTGQTYVFYGKVTGEGYRRQMVNPSFEREGGQRPHRGIFPVYPLTAGITNRFLTGLVRGALACLPQVAEPLGGGPPPAV